MEINVHYSGIDSTPSLGEYIEKKAESLKKLLSALDPEDTAVLHVELARTTQHHHKGMVYKVGVRLIIPGKTFHAEHEAEDIHGALDLVKDTLHTSLERYKDISTETAHNRQGL